MDALQEKEAMQNLPFREDGSIDLMELGRRQGGRREGRNAQLAIEVLFKDMLR